MASKIDEIIRQVSEAVAKATPGPWEAHICDIDDQTECTVMDKADTMAFRLVWTVPAYEPWKHHEEARMNARFVEVARNHLPALLEHLAVQQAALKQAAEALEMAIPELGHMPDKYCVARACQKCTVRNAVKAALALVQAALKGTK